MLKKVSPDIIVGRFLLLIIGEGESDFAPPSLYRYPILIGKTRKLAEFVPCQAAALVGDGISDGLGEIWQCAPILKD